MSCPDCVKGVELTGEPTGVIDLEGAYFAASPTGSPSRVAVILLTDIFGLALKNPKLMADAFAKELGCDVWVPDIFVGKPPVRSEQMKLPERPGEKLGFWGWVKLIFTIIPNIPLIVRHRPSVVEPRVIAFIKKLQAEKKYEKLGAVGYCFGGILAINLGTTDLVNSVVIAHPGRFSEQTLKAIKVPNAWACAEEDMSFSPEQRLRAEAEFEGRKGKDNFVEYEFKDYKGTTHGFAARPNLSYPEVKAGFEGAVDQTVDWFKKTLL